MARGDRRAMPKLVRNPVAVQQALQVACAAHPDQRVMQVIVNALGPDPFYVEDPTAYEALMQYAEKGQHG